MREKLRALRLGHGLWVLVDQGAVSLGTFLTNIIVARAMPRDEYGVYVVLVSIILLLNGFHAALIVYPLSVRGAASDREKLGVLAGDSLSLTVGFALVFTLAALAACVVLGRPSLFIVVSVALVAWQLQETVRRALMAHLHHRAALIGDSVSYLGQAAVVWMVAQQRLLTLELVFESMALSSGLAAIIQSLQLGVRLASPATIRRSAVTGFVLGRWLAMGTVLSVPALQTIPWALAFFHGVGDAGAFQAAANVIGISHPVIFGISSVLIPAVARARHDRGFAAARHVAMTYAAQGAALLAPFYLLLLAFPRQILELFYGSTSPYLSLESVLRLFVLVYVLTYSGAVLGGLLNGLERSRAVFAAQLASAAVALVISVPLAAFSGISGAVAGRAVSDAAKVGTLVWSSRAKGADQSLGSVR